MTLSLPWNNFESDPAAISSGTGAAPPDDRTGRCYLPDDSLKTAIKTALVVQRPLIISGPPGCGKSSLAPFVARNLGWRYYEFNIKRGTQAKDLFWHFDALSRLRDAQAQEPSESLVVDRYLTPGVMWWALNRKSADIQLERKNNGIPRGPEKTMEPCHEINKDRDAQRSVILIDEIDKADPHLPGDLLDVMGLYRFTIEENGREIQRADLNVPKNLSDLRKAASPLVIFTTNGDRDMPPAFIRRCVTFEVVEPTEGNEYTKRFIEIAKLHFASEFGRVEHLATKLATKCIELGNDRRHEQQRRRPSVAEYIDALRACDSLNIDPDSDVWQYVEQCTLRKMR